MHGLSPFRSPLLLCVGALLLVCSRQEQLRDEATRVIWPKTDLAGIEMIDEERAIVVGENGLLLRTRDGGDTWQRIDLEDHPAIEPIRFGQHELESIGRRRDPTALFELTGARVQEVRTLIEEARIAPERIVATGTPPWDYHDYLDDDPEFLERDWHERSARQSEIRIRILDERLLRSLPLDDAGLGLAVGESGTLLRSIDGGETWLELDSGFL